MDLEQKNSKENEMTIIDGMPASVLTGTDRTPQPWGSMDKMQLFCRHIRAALACYEDMPPEGQARARLYVTRKAGAIRNLKAASDAPGGELAGELLQKMQQPD